MTPKRCTNCLRWYSEAEWAALPLLGTMPGFRENGERCRLEVKNCTCHTTLAIELPAEEKR